MKNKKIPGQFIVLGDLTRIFNDLSIERVLEYVKNQYSNYYPLIYFSFKGSDYKISKQIIVEQKTIEL